MSVTAAQKTQIIDAHLQTAEGRVLLIAAMTPPMRLRLDYYGLHTHMAGPKTVSGPLIEVRESFTVSTREEDRFQLFEKAQHHLRVAFGSAMDKHLLGLVREAVTPTEEPFPKGWQRVTMNLRTQRGLAGAGAFVIRSGPDILGGIPLLEGASPCTNEHIEPGLLYAFGPPEEVGVCHYDIELTDASPPGGKVDAVTVDAKLTFAMCLADDPRVAIYAWPL